MNEFVLMFRMDIITKEVQPSPKQMKLFMNQWMEWINDISAQGQLADGGNHLSRSGKVLRSKNVITDEPYRANKESVAGYIIILAKDIDDAVGIAKKCPILQGEGTSVEVRETATPETMRTTKKTTNR
ncbi:MAG: YciI family protein [Bacteroidales bacterium]